ncbi:hypothetical protein NPIL_683871 [Nephila pilipes]|uniref:Uncharacterized protein n=1 Tax=Nephila pilipes TaxID=299642 RepID=A0A8X6N0J4_NEPPI|nr:hypothetical protein NPIL_683871 [Nephila pilipes]
MPLNVNTEMVISKKLSDVDIAALIEASNIEEKNASEYENHTSDEIESDSSNNDSDQQMHYIQNIQTKNHNIQREMDTILHSGRLTSAIILETTPGVP